MSRITHLAVLLTAAVFTLSGCGSGGGGNVRPDAPSDAGPSALDQYHRDQFHVPLTSGGLTPASAANNEPANTPPNSNFGLIGGVNVEQALYQIGPSLNQTRSHEGVEIGYGRVRDGVSANELLRYLRADARHYPQNLVSRWGSTPPTVRMLEGATVEDLTHTLNTVRLINSALPAHWQLRFDDSPVSRTRETPPSVIRVGFEPQEYWPDAEFITHETLGVAFAAQTGGRLTAAEVYVDPFLVQGEVDRTGVLLHEILHALGRGHVDPSAFPETIMHAYGLSSSEWLILNPLDEAGLFAVYDRLRPGESGNLDHNDLGPWSDVSTHVMGRLGYIPGRYEAVLFGAAWQNGQVRPWAMGFLSPPLPRDLTGSASWAGRLLGLTPRAETVAGSMDMTLQLGTMNGAIGFDDLEKWLPHAGPGILGSGVQWGDGDLDYRLAVHHDGHVFFETGGDEGQVTGAFFGDQHQKVGGTLRRTDLAAGFAGAL